MCACVYVNQAGATVVPVDLPHTNVALPVEMNFLLLYFSNCIRSCVNHILVSRPIILLRVRKLHQIWLVTMACVTVALKYSNFLFFSFFEFPIFFLHIYYK